MSTRVAFSSSVSYVDRLIPAAANASSVGAKSVKGPSPDNVSTKSTWARAETSESCTPVSDALVGISLLLSAVAIVGKTDIISRAIRAVASFLCIVPERFA